MSRKIDITYATVCILAKADEYVSVQELAETIYPGGNKVLEMQVYKAVPFMTKRGLAILSEEDVSIYDMDSAFIKVTDKGLDLSLRVELKNGLWHEKRHQTH